MENEVQAQENGAVVILKNSKDYEVGRCSHKGIKIDVGCGVGRDKDMIGIDETAQRNVDIVRSLSVGLPFCDRSVEYIKAHNILEHLGEEFHFVMKEFWRVMQDGGVLDIVVPGAFSDGGMRDPTHRRHFTRSTFDYFIVKRPRYHSYMDDAKWIILERAGTEDGTITVKMTPDRRPETIQWAKERKAINANEMHSPTPPEGAKLDGGGVSTTPSSGGGD